MVNILDCYINNEISLKNLGVYLPTRPCVPSNSKELEYRPVPGRDGDLTVFKGWRDRPFQLEFNLVDFENLNKKIREVRAIFLKAKTIMFSEDMEVYYKIKSVEINDISRQLKMFGGFTVNFILEPFDYSTDTDVISISTNSNIYNSCTHYSNPFIKVYGKGNLQLSINNNTFQIDNVNNYVVIDSELKHCFEEASNKDLKGNWPIFDIGANEIIKSSNITRIEIEPRWRYI
ncbi:MAG: hypothetical protein ACRC7S_14825 [Cetobacterium sp.]